MAGGRAEGTLTASLRPRSKNIKKTEPETNDNLGQAGVSTHRPFTLLFLDIQAQRRDDWTKQTKQEIHMSYVIDIRIYVCIIPEK